MYNIHWCQQGEALPIEQQAVNQQQYPQADDANEQNQLIVLLRRRNVKRNVFGRAQEEKLRSQS